MELYRLTSLARSVDLSRPTNRLITVLSLLVIPLAATLAVLLGRSVGGAIMAAATLALFVFLTWALGRELDPDHDPAAFVGTALALLPITVLGRPSLAAVLLVLLLLRIVNRTVGPPAKPIDSLAILVLVALTLSRGQWMLGVAAVAALALDAVLPRPYRPHLAAALVVLLLMGWLGLRHAGGWELRAPGGASRLALITAIPYLRVIAAPAAASLSDAGAQPLDPRRARAAQIVGLATLAGAVWLGGLVSLRDLSPLWAAIVGCGLASLARPPGRRPVRPLRDVRTR